jgi:hypothetical protein
VDEYVAKARDEALERPRFDTEKRAQRLLQLAGLENEDALRVLAEVGLHPNVQDLLSTVAQRLERARGASTTQRIDELDQIRKLLERARGQIVN